MGFTKWMIKNGPGSIGSIAKFWSKQFINAQKEEEDIEEIFRTIFLSFRAGLLGVGKKTVMSDVDEVVELSFGRFDKLLVFMIIENAEYLKALYNNRKLTIIMLEVITEVLIDNNISHLGSWDSLNIAGLQARIGYNYSLLQKS